MIIIKALIIIIPNYYYENNSSTYFKEMLNYNLHYMLLVITFIYLLNLYTILFVNIMLYTFCKLSYHLC